MMMEQLEKNVSDERDDPPLIVNSCKRVVFQVNEKTRRTFNSHQHPLISQPKQESSPLSFLLFSKKKKREGRERTEMRKFVGIKDQPFGLKFQSLLQLQLYTANYK